MARLLPLDAAPPANPIAARLEALLASLPDEWTLIPHRTIGGEDGPRVGFVLLHPEIGIALVDVAPARPADAVGPLAALLAEHDLDPESLPIVAVAIAPDALDAVGERLAAAFADASLCHAEDLQWPGRVAGMLLAAEDAAMAPIRPAGTVAAPEPDWRPRVEPEDAFDDRPLPRGGARRTLALAVAASVVAAVIVAAGAYLSPPARAPHATASIPVTPPIQPFPAQPGPPAADLSSPPALAELPAVAPAPAQKPVVAEAPPLPPRPAPHQAAPAPVPDASSVTRPAAKASMAASHPVPTPTAPPAATPNPPATDKPVASVLVRSPLKPMKTRFQRADAKPNPTRSPAPATTEASDGPPLDAADLPPLEGALEPLQPRQAVNVPIGAPVPLPMPYSGAPATEQPVMLLPPVAPPAAMPAPPAFGAGGASLVGATPSRR